MRCERRIPLPALDNAGGAIQSGNERVLPKTAHTTTRDRDDRRRTMGLLDRWGDRCATEDHGRSILRGKHRRDRVCTRSLPRHDERLRQCDVAQLGRRLCENRSTGVSGRMATTNTTRPHEATYSGERERSHRGNIRTAWIDPTRMCIVTSNMVRGILVRTRVCPTGRGSGVHRGDGDNTTGGICGRYCHSSTVRTGTDIHDTGTSGYADGTRDTTKRKKIVLLCVRR